MRFAVFIAVLIVGLQSSEATLSHPQWDTAQRRAPVDARRFSTHVPLSLQCVHVASCSFFQDVLLVIKLNPTRILWIDALLQYYSAGFQHVVFFSALRHNDTSLDKFLRVGAYNTEVHLIDDNYGFCDHETVATAASWWPGFGGYMYVSDDVLVHYWKLTSLPKGSVWRQKPQWRHVGSMTAAERGAMSDMQHNMPEVLRRIQKKAPANSHSFPFAPTSGVYFVPHVPRTIATFRNVSALLMRHRTYNEWGTPIVLAAASEDFVPLQGRLVWGKKRLQAVRTMTQTHHAWYHPVRASSETFSRMLHWVRNIAVSSGVVLTPSTLISASDLFSPCFICATHRRGLLLKKGLYHSCRLAVSKAAASLCLSQPSSWEGRVALWDEAARRAVERVTQDADSRSIRTLTGGNVVVPAAWAGLENPYEVDHEGFWGRDVTVFIYESYYPTLNTSVHRFMKDYPECCEV